jgi:hypothetical protein
VSPYSTLLAFVNPFPLDAGHTGQQEATEDPNEEDGLDECVSELMFHLFPLMKCATPDILTCDNEILLDNVSASPLSSAFSY